MKTEQECNDWITTKIVHEVELALDDVIKRQEVTNECSEHIRRYVNKIEKLGMFDHWWKNDFLIKEADKFLKDPKRSVSTIKLQALGHRKNIFYSVFFNLRCESTAYYQAIKNKTLKEMVKQSSVIFLRVDEVDIKGGEDKTIFEQGFRRPKFQEETLCERLTLNENGE